MELADLNLVDPNLLPPQMRRLVEIIGLPETLALLEARGGTFIHVPHQADADTVLGAILSLVIAIGLVCHALWSGSAALARWAGWKT